MRILLIAIDGLGDRPVKRGKTPLQLAKTSNLDKLAKSGINGISYPVGIGLVPGSDTGHLSLLGYDPEQFYVGRGVLEALGSGVKLYEGDLAFRCNLATVDSKFNVTDRRAGRPDERTVAELAKAIANVSTKEFTFLFSHTKGHRGVLIVRSKFANPMVSDIDSHNTGPTAWAKPLDQSDDARKTADALNDWLKKVHQILKSHPINKDRAKKKLPEANFILTRGASMLVEGQPHKGAVYSGPYGKNVRIQKFSERYGMGAACVAGGALYKGVARYLGMEIIDVKGATANVDTDLNAKVSASISALKNNDFVFLHIKGTDVAGHDGDWQKKMKFIERIDKAIAPLLKLKDTIIVVTADHSTSCALKAHSADPVPIVIWAPEGMVRVDGVNKFDEISAPHGGLGRIKHKNVMPILLGILGKAPMYGT